MRWLGAGVLVAVLVGVVAAPSFAQSADFPAKRWFAVETLNGADVRDKALTFFADTVSPDGAPVPTASGSGGCNTWRASYEIKAPDQFKLGDIASTKKMCSERLVMMMEGYYLLAMVKIARWRMDAAALVLTGDQTTMRLTPQAQP
jgi:heat shock protein HslJ